MTFKIRNWGRQHCHDPNIIIAWFNLLSDLDSGVLDSGLRLNEISASPSDSSTSLSPLETIELNPGLKFTVEERRRVNYLLELEQSNVISFNDLEYEVASKVKGPGSKRRN